MQLVINVDEKDVEFVKENFKPTGYSSIPLSIQTEFISAILNGVPDSFMNKPETVTEFADRCRECGKQKTAHWIKVPDEETFFCSKCNAHLYDEQTYLPLNYCPNCGRKMVKPQESEE